MQTVPQARTMGIYSEGRRQIHSSSAAWKDASATDASADDASPKEPTPYEKEVAEAEAREGNVEGPVPEWQNPRHHNNPEMDKIFFEDFEEGETPQMMQLPPFSNEDGGIIASQELHEIADDIIDMNMLEVKELVDRIGEHFGLEDEPVFLGGGGGGGPAAGAGGEGAEAEEKEEEKTAFDVKLVGFDAKAKIKVIKEVRAAAGLGLKEAKELVEGAPKVIKKDIKKEEAEELKAKLEELGATVEIV